MRVELLYDASCVKKGDNTTVNMLMNAERTGGALTVFLEGELDHHSAAPVRAQIDALLSDGNITELTLDMRAVTFMDSSGLGVVLGRYRIMSGRNGKMYIGGASKYVQRILKMAGVYSIVGRKEEADNDR